MSILCVSRFERMILIRAYTRTLYDMFLFQCPEYRRIIFYTNLIGNLKSNWLCNQLP